MHSGSVRSWVGKAQAAAHLLSAGYDRRRFEMTLAGLEIT